MKDFASQHRADGRVEGWAEALLLVLEARGVVVSEEVRRRITGCADLERLENWVRQVAAAGSADDLFNGWLSDFFTDCAMTVDDYEWKSDFALRHRAVGRSEGLAEALLMTLETRGITVSEEVRRRITGCGDLERLENWVRRATTADSAEELFD
ncbi:hypothetical protein [Thermomonospora amylolytica]|uniref:hypothetical protein n=1 Tax=Thermomonospora amylolytica TaxID=1411117 RepID=UPI001F30DAE3|nr:hypothetical protein [Thermomonospora amylolytica]